MMEGEAKIPLTQAQIDRIAHNKASALARLAKARGLVAWAGLAPPQAGTKAAAHLPSQSACIPPRGQLSASPEAGRGALGPEQGKVQCAPSGPAGNSAPDMCQKNAFPAPKGGSTREALSKDTCPAPFHLRESGTHGDKVTPGAEGRPRLTYSQGSSIDFCQAGQGRTKSWGGAVEWRAGQELKKVENTPEPCVARVSEKRRFEEEQLQVEALGAIHCASFQQNAPNPPKSSPVLATSPGYSESFPPPLSETHVEKGPISKTAMEASVKVGGSSSLRGGGSGGAGAVRPNATGAAQTALEAFSTAGLTARCLSGSASSLIPDRDSASHSGASPRGLSAEEILSSTPANRGKKRRSDGGGGQRSIGPFLRWPKQVFDYFLVIDFECTCDNEKSLEPQEIIEFPSVLLNARSLRIEDSFRVFCRPEVHSTLTSFCTRFTGIQQAQVDAGVSLLAALEAHDTWLRGKGLLDKPNRFAVVTWTDWDCKIMLEMECKWKRIQKPAYFNQWINLKHPFAKVFPKAKGTCHGLRGHVTYAGVKWEGREHSGLDDATNTAWLAAAVIRQGGLLTITDSFKIYAADGSKIERILKKRPLLPADGNAQGQQPGKVPGGRCHCGVKRKRRTVKKPGPTHGQAFFSCGKWTITAGGCCDYFEWVGDGGRNGQQERAGRS